MPAGPRRRPLVIALVVAIVVGFGLGWYARVWSRSTPESRLHDAADRLRERVRDLTR